MQWQAIDWVIIDEFFPIVSLIRFVASKTAGENTAEFFPGGRGMPWWLPGTTSLVTIVGGIALAVVAVASRFGLFAFFGNTPGE